jgi:hypothetical protein
VNKYILNFLVFLGTLGYGSNICQSDYNCTREVIQNDEFIINKLHCTLPKMTELDITKKGDRLL